MEPSRKSDMKCSSCREKDAELLTWWEKTRNWIFLRMNHMIFPQDFEDLRSEKYTQGLSDGIQRGIEMEEQNSKKLMAQFMDAPVPNVMELVEKELCMMLSVVDMKKVITFDERKGAIFIGGERAEPSALANLKSEAEFLQKSDIWPLLNASIRRLAEIAMFEKGENIESMQKGRSMIYLLSTQNKILDTLASYQQQT